MYNFKNRLNFKWSMFSHNINFFNKMSQWIFFSYQFVGFFSWNSDCSFNITCKRITELWSYKVNVLLISIQGIHISSSFQNLSESTWSSIRLETTSDKLVFHKSTFSDKTVIKVFNILLATFFDITELSNHFFHVF